MASIHYSDVIMGALASQITSLSLVYSTVYSGADQRKHQSSASLAFVLRKCIRKCRLQNIDRFAKISMCWHIEAWVSLPILCMKNPFLDIWKIWHFFRISLRLVPGSLINCDSASVQTMASRVFRGNHYLNQCWTIVKRPISQIPQCTCLISHNTPFR